MTLPFFSHLPCWLLADTAGSWTSRELDWPDTVAGGLLLVFGSLAVLAWVIWLYRRDTQELPLGWRLLLAGLRISALGGLLIIALNPQDRTQRTAFRPSRAIVLIDTSLSMRHPASEMTKGATTGESRTAAIQNWLKSSPFLSTLQREHEVSIFSFDTALNGPVAVLPYRDPDAEKPAASSSPATPALDWIETLQPQGTETRLGEALGEVIRQSAGRTLSGIVVVTDGGQNAGVDPITAHDRAIAAKARLIAVGVGSVEQPLNVQIADIQSPTDVQLGDSFDLTGYVQAQGLAGRDVKVELLAAQDGQNEAPLAISTQNLTLPDDGLAAELKFNIQPVGEGGWKYTLRVQPTTAVSEFNQQDNEQTVSVRVFDRPTRVLLFAGGPMRDYQFVRNLLYRHKSIDVDVLLQTAAVGSSQESDNLLAQFPATREQLYEYDVIIAFDPDWRQIPAESILQLSDWVDQEGGGLVLVAGDVFTVQLASAADQASPQQLQLSPLKDLYPVVLNSYLAEMRFDNSSSQPWPIEFTPEGQRAEFLQLTDDPLTSLARWKEFAGFYRCYPTSGAKAGATVLARFSDPRSQNEYGFPVLLAEQFFGQGRTLYLGSAEVWRLRAVSDADYDRFWIKTIREVGQGRTKRGTRRGVLLPESRKLLLGQTARLRARLLDAQFQPLAMNEVRLEVIDPAGKPMLPSPRLRPDPSRPGEYVGDFRVSQAGVYRLELPVPESNEQITDELVVALPKLEDQDVRQNVAMLTDLVRDTGGEVLTLETATARLPELLQSRGELFTIDERLQSLWDRGWVMYLLVGLLAAEWLTRKLLKLA
ncbi:VWA domain-containing protein [bacterium]|nr:VWA domain-containing protein [bacterium]